MHQVDKVPLLGVPIVIASDSIRDEIVNIVDKIIAISVANEQNVLAKDNKIGDYIGQIDKMVYELYGLTTEEIKIVEKQ